MTTPIAAHLATLKKAAEAGVDYSPRTGVLCPACGSRSKPYKTMPWDGNTRIRYHKCQQKGCILATINQTIKSVEVDKG